MNPAADENGKKDLPLTRSQRKRLKQKLRKVKARDERVVINYTSTEGDCEEIDDSRILVTSPQACASEPEEDQFTPIEGKCCCYVKGASKVFQFNVPSTRETNLRKPEEQKSDIREHKNIIFTEKPVLSWDEITAGVKLEKVIVPELDQCAFCNPEKKGVPNLTPNVEVVRQMACCGKCKCITIRECEITVVSKRQLSSFSKVEQVEDLGPFIACAEDSCNDYFMSRDDLFSHLRQHHLSVFFELVLKAAEHTTVRGDGGKKKP